MADLRNQLAEIYVKVSVDTKAASEAAKKQAEILKEQAKGHQEVADKAKDAIKKVEKLGDAANKKSINRVLKAAKLDDLLTKDQIKNLESLAKKAEKNAKKQEDLAKKRMEQHELVEQFIRKRIDRFTDFSGRMDDQDLKNFEKAQLQKAAAYESFLKRASSEHGRFVTRLDQRDMTASTIENMRRGFAKGILVSNKWHKDENTLQRIGRSVGMAAGSLRKMRDDSEMAMMTFQRLQRVAYALQAAIGAIAGTIGSLVGGLMSLIGVLGQAAYSMVAVGSAFASIIAGGIAAKIALGGVGEAVSAMLDPQKKLAGALRNTRRELRNLRFEAEEAALSQEEAAINLEKAREELARVQDLPPDSRVRRETELQFQQAELAYRRAKARNKEAREDLKKGPAGGSSIPDPLAKLTESQKDFAKYLVTLKPLMDQLKEAAASGFLPLLQDSIENLVANGFSTLRDGLNTLGIAMGRASQYFSVAFTTPENLLLLQKFFVSSRPIIETFGKVAGNALGGVLGLLAAARPLTERFSKWIESSSQKFENWGKGSGLEKFLNLSGDVAASLGKAVGSVFGGLKNLINATFPGGNPNAGAGGIMLQWLNNIAEGFKAFTGNAEFAGWLQESTRNATTALSAIGALLKPIMDIAAMPEIGEFWTILRGAAEPLKKMLEDGAKAAPEFAELLVSVTRLFAAFSDSGALESFFKTLKVISDAVTVVATALKSVLDFVGKIHGAFLAIGLAIIVAKGFFMVMSGITKTVFITIGRTADVMLRLNAQTTTAAMRFASLRKEGQSVSAAMGGVVKGFVDTARKAAATRRAAVLVQMAKDAGMSTQKLAILEKQLDDVIMKQGIYSKSGMVNAAIANRPKSLGAGANPAILQTVSGQKTAMGKPSFAGGRAASGLAGGALALGGLAGGLGGSMSPLVSALGGISMAASLIPGPVGLIASAVTGLGAAAVGLMDSADAAKKAAEEENKQRDREIKAQNVAITAQNVDTQQSTTDALLGAGAKGADLQGIIDAATAKIGNAAITGVTDNAKAFETLTSSGFAATFVKGSEGQQNSLIASIETIMKAQNKTFEEAAAALAPIYSEGGGGSKGVKAIESYIKDKGLDKLVTVTDTTGNNKVYTVSPEEASRLQAEWSKRDSDAATRKAAVPNIAALEGALSDGGINYSSGANRSDLVMNENVYKALGMTYEQFIKEFAKDGEDIYSGLNISELRTALEGALETNRAALTAATPATGNPYVPFTPSAPVAPPTGAANPYVPFSPYIPAAPTANTASTGPKGTAAEPLNVTDPSLKGLGPAITKLANATPSVVVVNVKNKSELDSLYKRLGLPSGT